MYWSQSKDNTDNTSLIDWVMFMFFKFWSGLSQSPDLNPTEILKDFVYPQKPSNVGKLK